jgi:hypothetical protein
MWPTLATVVSLCNSGRDLGLVPVPFMDGGLLMRRILLLLVTMSFAVLMASGVALAVTTTFTHHRPIVLALDYSGGLQPPDSTIQVSGLSGTIQDVNVKLTRFSDTCPGLVEVLLFHNGTFAEVLANDGGCDDVRRINLVLDEDASTELPSPGGPLTSGTYRTNQDIFPAPLSVFNGQDPNGEWTLSVTDFSNFDSGKIGAWSVQITTN